MVERLHRRLKESLMALGNQDRGNWFWRLPMTLLSLRTTVKPDLGASPSELVYGEGVAVPGQLLPSPTITDEELLRRQRRTLSNLRMEVERLQPTPTSAHRRPPVHIPEELNTCTHVFVLRGGVQPTLTTPYEGPFRVISRTPAGFRIEFPGRPSDVVALSRLRPAVMSPDDDESQDNQQDHHDPAPPSPPPPGRRPGLRTRIPEATDRVTRSAAARRPSPSRVQHDEGGPAQASLPANPAQRRLSPLRESPSPPPSPHHPDSFGEPVADTEPEVPAVDPSPSDEAPRQPSPNNTPAPPVTPPRSAPTRTFTSHQERTFSRRGGPVPALDIVHPQRSPAARSQNQGGEPGPRTRVLSFSNPKPGNFSHRRRRPDISALNAIIRSCLS